MDLILRQLTENNSEAFFQALAQWDSSPGFLFAQGYQPSMSLGEYIKLLKANEIGERLQQGYVPATILCGFVGDNIVSRVSIRHQLNDFLFKIGGNIGYGVLPSYRRMGYAKATLTQSLEVSKSIGLERALITCDDNNIASIKTIEGCDGRLENKIEVNGLVKRRYWIDLGH